MLGPTGHSAPNIGTDVGNVSQDARTACFSCVNPTPCTAQGLTAGYGHVILGFTNDGATADVRVELPSGSTPQGRVCVEQAFRAVRVSAFDGAPVDVRRAFFVKDAASSADGPDEYTGTWH